MKRQIIGVGIGVLVLVGAIYAIGVSFPDGEDRDQENETLHPTVEETICEGTSYIEIRTIDGRRVILYPEDRRYPAIEAECREQIQGINGQLETGYSWRTQDAMKRNGTFVAIHFLEPTHFVTSSIVDGSPLEITIEEALFFLDMEDEPNMVITPSQNGSGVWTTSRDRSKLAALATQVLVEEGRSGEKVSPSLANLTFAQVDFPSMPETVPLYRLEAPEVTKEIFHRWRKGWGLRGRCGRHMTISSSKTESSRWKCICSPAGSPSSTSRAGICRMPGTCQNTSPQTRRRSRSRRRTWRRRD